MFTDYILRFGALVLFIIALISYDLIRKKDYTRLKEYSVIFIAAFATGVFGIIIDMLTCRISPEYFRHGKGVNTVHEIIIMGGLAGISAGFFLTAILVYINRNNDRKFQVLKYLPLCFVLSVLFAAGMGAIRYYWASYRFDDLEILMNPAEIHMFMTVWFVHLGVYAGGVIGVVISGFLIKKQTP